MHHAFFVRQQLETSKVPINMVDLPLGATEDRVCGTIDIEKALTGQHNFMYFVQSRVDGVHSITEGTKAFEPGLLAKVTISYSLTLVS